MGDEEILERLLALNLARAQLEAGEAARARLLASVLGGVGQGST